MLRPPLGLLLVTPFSPNVLSEDSCISSNFYGNYLDGRLLFSIFTVPNRTCFDFWDSRGLESAHYGQPFYPDQQLVWLQKADVDSNVHIPEAQDISPLDDDLWFLVSSTPTTNDELQASMSNTRKPRIHYRSATAALISVDVDLARVIDTLMPPFWISRLLPTQPTVYRPVSHADVDPILSKLEFNPVIASVVNNISISQIKNDIRFLTGEDSASGITSRHSFTPGAVTAAKWLKERLEDTGASCQLEHFLVGFAPNVICRYNAVKETNAIVLISAHYDSRGSFGSTRAPGGDDDGSGTVGVLSIARTIARKGIKFHSNVELAFFAGEEQGLLGSRAYANKLRSAGANLILVVQADMTAYRAPEEPMQLGLPESIGTPEVTQLVAKISGIYSPELQVGYTSVCCSDHQSFFEQGYPATHLFERAGPIADPMYHNSGDISDREGFDLNQLYAIAKVQFATLLHVAGFELKQDS